MSNTTLRAVACAIGSAAFLVSAAAIAADPPCTQWNVPSTFNIDQANGTAVSCDLTHDPRAPTRFKGSCEHDHRGSPVFGKASGRLQGRRFTMEVRWSNGSVGQYTAFMGGGETTTAQDGRTFDASHPARWSTWTGSPRATCRR